MRMRWIGYAALLMTITGCAGRTEWLANKDEALQKTPAEFAADAAKRHPYKADAPRGGQAMARAEIGYVLDQVAITNTSNADWTDVEVWVNGQYVCYLPRMEAKILKTIPFRALYDSNGQYFPTSNGKWFNREPVMVKKVELYRDGKLYDVPVQLAE